MNVYIKLGIRLFSVLVIGIIQERKGDQKTHDK